MSRNLTEVSQLAHPRLSVIKNSTYTLTSKHEQDVRNVNSCPRAPATKTPQTAFDSAKINISYTKITAFAQAVQLKNETSDHRTSQQAVPSLSLSCVENLAVLWREMKNNSSSNKEIP